MKTIILLLFILPVIVIPAMSLAGTVFMDNFSNGSTVNQSPISPTINSTSYEIISSKPWNPIPSLTFNDLNFGINATLSGSIEAQALFATSPVKLSAVGDQIELTVTFTDTAGILIEPGTMGFGLYNSGQSPPVPGGLNGTAVTNNFGAVTGWAQNWQGYVGQVTYAGNKSQIVNRAAQTGAYNNNQDLVVIGSSSFSYINPPGTTIGSKIVSSVVLNTGALYTEVFQITLVGANTLAITNFLYSGPSVYGTLISQFGAEAFGTNFLVNSFDGFAIGWRETSNQPTVIDISSVQVSDQISDIPPTAPRIISPPISLAVTNGSFCIFSVSVSGSPAPSCQWRFNGQNIPGATGTILNLNSVTAANSGAYSVIVSNAYGSVTSDTASLAVLGDGANGSTPKQIALPTVPAPSPKADSLIVVTHGWEPLQPNADLSWVTNMCNAIRGKVPGNWLVTNIIWLTNATFPEPDLVLEAARTIGMDYGRQLSQQNWKHVHLIGHSAGSRLIQAIADQLSSSQSPPIVQLTFLDPYLGSFLQEQGIYGRNANYADCYFTQDYTGGDTSGGLPDAYNVDVDWADPNYYLLPFGTTFVAFSTHGYPIYFYTATITNTDSTWCANGYGFSLSSEDNGAGNQINHAVGNNNSPTVLCGPPWAIPTPTFPLVLTDILIEDAANAVSGTETTVVNGAGFVLNSLWSSLPLAGTDEPQPLDETSQNTPAWLAVGVSITNAINLVQFDAAFTDTNSAQGLFTVYWNTNLIGMLDERAAETNLQTYRFELPGAVTSGLYTLSFRLDSFDNSSSIVVTNVATGFVGVQQPINLSVSLTNGTPLLQLTGATNFTYIIQSSTNLVDWRPAALLNSTSGKASFADPNWKNAKTTFYRALSP